MSWKPRNLVRAAAAHQAAKITGHKTLAVFNRYDIIDERDIVEVVEKLEDISKPFVWADPLVTNSNGKRNIF